MRLGLQDTVENGLRLVTKNLKLVAVGLVFGLFTSILDYIILGSYINPDITSLSSIELIFYFQKAFMSGVIKFLISVFFYGMIIKMSYDLIKGKGRSKRSKRRRKKRSGKGKGGPSVFDSIDFVSRKYLIFLFAYVLSTLFVIGGVILLIIPGIYIYFRLIFFPFAIMIDNESVIGSLRKSWRMTEDKVLKLMSIWGVIVLLMIGISVIISLLTVFLPVSQETIAELLVYTLQMPWITASFMHAYMKLRKRR